MNDPYAVLGVSRSATDDELTQAYRKLAKKYHPDMNPGNRAAEQRMQEINAAYDQIKNERSGRAAPGNEGAYGPGSSRYGGGAGAGGYDPFEQWFGGFGAAGWDGFNQNDTAAGQGAGQGQGTRSQRMVQVDLCVRSGYYRQALQILDSIDLSQRDAEWFYYSAIANAGVGNRVTALRHAREAVNLNPGNDAYVQLLNQLERSGYAYRQTGASQGFDMRNLGRALLQCIFSPLLCYCCCPLCRC